MSSDFIDQMFSDGQAPEDEEQEYYPGSRRKRNASPDSGVEFIPDPWREKYNIKVIKGVETKMYPVGALANALGVSVQSIRHWTNKGYIPAAPFRLPSNMVVKGQKVSGRRLYTEALIDAAVEAFERRGLLGKPRITWSKHRDLSIEIKESWSRILNEQPTTGQEN